MDLRKKRRFQHEATGCCFFLSKREGKEDDGWISDCSDRGAGEKVEIYTTRCMYVVGFRLREHRKRLPRSPQTGKISTAAGRATGAHPFFLAFPSRQTTVQPPCTPVLSPHLSRERVGPPCLATRIAIPRIHSLLPSLETGVYGRHIA